jgi:ligand-binding sensor domain-containing protein/signal transduction histidine kinase
MPRWATWLVLGWYCGCGLLSGGATEAKLAAPGYWGRTWQTDEGLPRNTINAIAQTPEGYLWLGTPFGVIRFDGANFQRMEGDYYAGFTRARSRVLHTDAEGRLWIGTGTAGIIRYDGKSFTVIDSQKGLPHPTVSAICEDLWGKIWVASQDGSLSWVDAEDAVHPVAPFRGERITEAIQLVRDIQGRLWFAQGNAYGMLVDGAATNVTVAPGGPVTLCASRNGGLWLTFAKTLQKLPGPETDVPPVTLAIPTQSVAVPVLFEDHAGGLWLGTQQDGVFRFANGEFRQELNSSHRILSIFEDAETNLWVGTEGGGLSRLRPRTFHSLTPREGLPQSIVLSVCEDDDGAVWLSGRGRTLMKWRADGGLESLPGFTNIGTTAVLPQPGNGVLVGTVGWGLFAVEAGQKNQFGELAPLRNRQVRALHRDAQNRVWLGCLPDGLFCWADGHWRLPRTFFDQGLPMEAIWSLADDRQGRLWLGTISGGLWSYDGTAFTHYTEADGLPGASIGALLATAEGDLWIGTLGGGLGRLRNGRFVFADARHGLDDEVISGIVDDGLGYFWLSTDRGIARVRRQDLDEFADGRRDRFDCVHYGQDDGLGNIECIGGYQPAAWRTRAGKLWFATSKGAIYCDPAMMPTQGRPPKPVLEKVLLDGRDVTQTAQLQLHYGYQKLEFQFTAPSFAAPEQVRFRHQLVGLDADWIESGKVRLASYPRLAPGRYVFQFSARNRAGEWNPNPGTVAFEVLPAYWQTAWFRVTTWLAFGALVAGGVRYRYVQKMRRRLHRLEEARAVEQERMRIARDIHDDLGARLTQMAFLGDMVAKDIGTNGRAGERLGKLADSAREAIRSLDEIVWAVNPRKDSLPDFVDYLSHYANEFFRSSDVRCRQQLPLLVPPVPLPTELRHHLFLACKETLTNVSKHAQATEVWLRLAVDEHALEIGIEDNGRGFRPASGGHQGNGLPNLQNRLGAIGGTCRVDSAPGQGTHVHLRVRLPAPPAGAAPHSTPRT